MEFVNLRRKKKKKAESGRDRLPVGHPVSVEKVCLSPSHWSTLVLDVEVAGADSPQKNISISIYIFFSNKVGFLFLNI